MFANYILLIHVKVTYRSVFVSTMVVVVVFNICSIFSTGTLYARRAVEI